MLARAEPVEPAPPGEPWQVALDRFAAAAAVAATLYDARGERRQGPLTPTPLLALLARRGFWADAGPGAGFERGLVSACLRSGAPVSDLFEGALRVCATPFQVRGVQAGVFVYGWVFERFGTTLECQRLAPLLGMSGQALWSEVRQAPPTSPERFATYGALLEAMIASNVSHAEALADLRALGKLRDIFLAHVSHELRSPLAAISLRVETLLRSDLSDPSGLRAHLERIARNCLDQDRMVEDLIETSRSATGQLAVTLEPTRLGAVIERALESVLPRAAEKRVGIAVPPNLPALDDRLVADPARLRQVFVNLLSNAIKFTPPQGAVRVHITPAAEHVEASITDSGSGIDAALLPRIFEAFTQHRPGGHKGLGIGLSVARQLVALHGGTIRAESAGAGQGARFTVRLPRARPSLGSTAG